MTAFCLIFEYADTVDMPDGQPLPPVREHGAVWNVVRRRRGQTVWRRLRLVPSAALTNRRQRRHRRAAITPIGTRCANFAWPV